MAETIRQKAKKAEEPRKPRRVRQAASTAGKGIKTATGIRKREIHLVKLPDNKLGRFMGKSRGLVPRFFRDAWAELKQVTWPSRRETIKLTSAVIIFAVIFGSLIAITDYGLEKLFKQLIG